MTPPDIFQRKVRILLRQKIHLTEDFNQITIEEGFNIKQEYNPFRSTNNKQTYQELDTYYNKCNYRNIQQQYTENESKGIKYDLFKDYFDFVVPSALVKQSYETKNKNKNNKLVKGIKNRWSNLKDEVEKMSEDEKEIEQPDKILKIVENILEFNRQQQGQGLKILTPNQMLSRLPITLAQLKAGSNSEKLKNEIRHLLYSLYRSKKLTKNIFKSLVDII